MEKFSAANCWKIPAVKDAGRFFRALPNLIPEDSILYIESGGEPPEDIKTFLLANRIDDSVVIPGGTLLPTPRIYRIAATRKSLEALAQLEEKHRTPVGSVHIHAYRGTSVLLWSYDAFLDPFFISKAIPENHVKRFCEELGPK